MAAAKRFVFRLVRKQRVEALDLQFHLHAALQPFDQIDGMYRCLCNGSCSDRRKQMRIVRIHDLIRR